MILLLLQGISTKNAIWQIEVSSRKPPFSHWGTRYSFYQNSSPWKVPLNADTLRMHLSSPQGLKLWRWVCVPLLQEAASLDLSLLWQVGPRRDSWWDSLGCGWLWPSHLAHLRFIHPRPFSLRPGLGGNASWFR